MLNKSKKYTIALAAVSFMLGICLFSCTNEVNINAPFTEKTIVWGLLDAGQTIHYLRIEKSFLSDNTSAYTLAFDPANLYYNENALQVYVEEWKNNLKTNQYFLERVDGDSLGIQKDTTGPFASSPNILYRFFANLDFDAEYKLYIINNNSGDTITASTKLVQPFTIYYPGASLSKINFADSGQINFTCHYAVNGLIYELNMKMYYDDINTSTNDTTHRSVNWQIFTNELADNATGEGYAGYDIPTYSFYTFARAVIPEDENVKREFSRLDFTYYAGGAELYNLYLNTLAGTGLNEMYATTIYTNLSNGYGIFSSRYAVTADSILLTDESLNKLACGEITSQLNFMPSPSNPYYPGCN